MPFKSQVKYQEEIISFLYKYELLNMNIDSIDAFENYDFNSAQLKEIEKLSELYPKLKTTVSKKIVDWKFERIAPLERAILIYGAFEMMFKDKELVINGMVMIAKGYIAGERYKFINATLDNIGGDYDKFKTSKK